MTSSLWVTQFSFMSPQRRQQRFLRGAGMPYGCDSPEVCQGLSLSSSCPNLQFVTTSHPHVIPNTSPPRAHPGGLCRPDLLKFHLLLCTPSTWSIPLRQRTSTDSCLDTLFIQSHTKDLVVFPTKAACPSWRHQQLIPAVPGCSSRSLSMARVTQTPHTGPLGTNQASATLAGRALACSSGEATRPLPRDGPPSLDLPFPRNTGITPPLWGYQEAKSSHSSG